jgi:hypothetical protein
MKTVRGRYNGSVVILEEPAPVDHEVSVLVEFPEEAPAPQGRKRAGKKYHWQEAQAIQDGYAGSLADEVIRQRREDRL